MNITTSSDDDDEEDVIILMIPFPAHSHLNQLLHLSRRLLLHYNIPVHYASTPSHNRQACLRLHGWPDISSAALTFHDLPIPLDHHHILLPLPDPLGFPSHLIHSAVAAAAHVRIHFADLLRRLSSRARKVIVINDSLMGFAAEEASLISNAESYTFHSVSAFCCFLHSWERMGKPQLITGVNIPADVPSFDGCFSSHFWDFISEQRQQLRFNSGFIYNTNRVIEADFIDHLQELQKINMTERKRHWALGPFNPVEIEQKKKKKHFTIEWLEEQACNSVVYVSFGTTTAMTEEQMKEIAVGLRRSCKKFIWVVREADRGDEAEDERRRVNDHDLPEGFEDSVKREDVGLVVRDWAPQLEILAHGAVGGFLTHCGWNSCMESMTMGKPMGAWPMHSDQPRNTVLVTQVLRLGLVVRPWEVRHRTATAEMVESGLRRLMEGDEMRRRAAELGLVLRGSVQKGEVSRAELDDFVAHITSPTTYKISLYHAGEILKNNLTQFSRPLNVRNHTLLSDLRKRRFCQPHAVFRNL